MYPDSGAHSGLWPLWGEQSGGDSEGGSQGSRAEAVAMVWGTVMEEWDSSLRSPQKQDHRSDSRTPPSPITPHFPAEDMKAHS